MSRTYYLYRIVNQINQKVYVGQTVAPSARWRDHRNASNNPKVPIQFAIHKYGSHNFEFEIIACCFNQDDANWAETELVKQYESHVSIGKGYNATYGGQNAPKSEEWKKKISEKLMGHSVSAETLQKLSESHKGQVPWNKGVSLSEEHLKNLRTSLKGRPAWNKDIPCSEEQKLKLRKLSPDQELEIINDTRSSRVLAQEYKVNKSTIVDIRKRYKENGNCHI